MIGEKSLGKLFASFWLRTLSEADRIALRTILENEYGKEEIKKELKRLRDNDTFTRTEPRTMQNLIFMELFKDVPGDDVEKRA
jgi:hypothetical protein